jgi:predicted Zn finger-like uncharacterized protein
MSAVRLRRLESDLARLTEYVRRHPRLQLVRAEGSPPEQYQIEYRIRSLRQKGGELVAVESHLVEIVLPRDYPRTPPLCRMLTPVFHPNIAPHAICIGDHWSAGESLSSLVARIGEMLAYQSYNTRSPLNGEAARWTDQNLGQLPLDPVNMTVEPEGQATPPPSPAVPGRAGAPAHPVSAPPAPPIPPAHRGASGQPVTTSRPSPPSPPQSHTPAAAAADRVVTACPGCGTRFRLAREYLDRRVRCPRCKSLFEARGVTGSD